MGEGSGRMDKVDNSRIRVSLCEMYRRKHISQNACIYTGAGDGIYLILWYTAKKRTEAAGNGKPLLTLYKDKFHVA